MHHVFVRRRGVVRDVWRDFHADVAVRAGGAVIDRAEHVRGIADVANRERLVHRHRLQITLLPDV
jgi:hypothetical protein